MKAEVFFICDRKKCKKCSYPICKRTEDFNHAVNQNVEKFNAVGLMDMDGDGKQELLLFEIENAPERTDNNKIVT